MRSTNGGGKLFLIRKPYKTNKNISRLFYILMMIIFVWFIGIQILGPDEQFFDQSGHSIIYNGTFTWKKSDGTKQNISVPGRYKVPAKQTMIITTTLPDDYNENVIAIRSSLQDVRFYIDGKLRKEYNAKSLQRDTTDRQKLCQPLYILQYFVCRCRKGTLSGTYNIYE